MDVDIGLHWHPVPQNCCKCLSAAFAIKSAKFRFHGTHPMAPDHQKKVVLALDGCR